MNDDRVAKTLASRGFCSRRAAEGLIRDGRVSVNGETAVTGAKASPEDEICVDGVLVPENLSEDRFVYIMLHKPIGVISSSKGQFGRKCVVELVGADARLYPVGRLDLNTTGLILLTNDGELANKLTHPSHRIDKTYIARVKSKPTDEALIKLRRGIEIEGRVTAPAAADRLRTGGGRDLRVTIREGRNRQVRKMLEAVGCPVVKLKRVATGKIKLGDLELGKWRSLTKREVEYLKRL